MMLTRVGRLAPALAVAAVLAACADQPSPMGPSALATGASFDLSTAAAGEGELRICKAGNSAGTFSFDWQVVERANPANVVASGTGLQVAVGQCVTAHQFPTTGSGRWLASVTETTPPANWALTNIAVSQAITVSWGVPVISVATRTASNIGMANDLGAEVTFTNTYTPPPPPPPPYCTLTQGYWKTHSAYGPAPTDDAWMDLPDVDGDLIIEGPDETFFLSGHTWYEVFWTKPAGNAYYILSKQYMAAVLNGVNGASTTVVDDELADAAALFAVYTPADIAPLKGKKPPRPQFISLAGTLASYNEGDIGPGHCDEDRLSSTAP